jgi:Major Facilitator Superfamily
LIPVFYAVAMATSALTAVLFGRLFDKFGANVALLAFLISAAFAPFVFLGDSLLALIGMIFLGIGMSAQGSLFQAMLTGVIPAEKRSTAFGLFDTGYGIAWFLGSAAMGLLYDKSILAVVLFSCCFKSQRYPCYISQTKAAKFCDGSIRETQGTKNRSSASQNHAFARGGRNPNTKRTGGREASRRGRATCHQKISAPKFKTATALRIRRGGLKSVNVSSASRVSTFRSYVVD